MHSTAVRAFADNYVWLVRRGPGDPLIIVDPGQAEPVLDALRADETPSAILLTHHHADHIGGVADLRERFPGIRVIGPTDSRVPADERVQPGDRIDVAGIEFEILDLSAHTIGHIGFMSEGHLFCGDALFSLGCGRLFEGTADDLTRVMDLMRSLAPSTQIYCAHEYTQANARFALAVDPHNAELRSYASQINELRSRDEITLPTTIAKELQCNPFLRSEDAAVAASIDAHFGSMSANRVERLMRLRQWKDNYA